MGRDKARLRVHGRSLLAWTRDAARTLGVTVRVLRRDAIPSCGPLGGIYTALLRTRAAHVIFLPCDMPLLRPELLGRVALAPVRHRAVCVEHGGLAGFPFRIPGDALAEVRRLIERGELSLQALARELRAVRIRVGHRGWVQLSNVNTPEALAEIRRHLRRDAAERKTPGHRRLGRGH